jgi:hypothetical protein
METVSIRVTIYANVRMFISQQPGSTCFRRCAIRWDVKLKAGQQVCNLISFIPAEHSICFDNIDLILAPRPPMSYQHEPVASTSRSISATLVVCFDAETADLAMNSTIKQLCNSAKKADGTIVHYAVRCPFLSAYIRSSDNSAVSDHHEVTLEGKLHPQLRKTPPIPCLNS